MKAILRVPRELILIVAILAIVAFMAQAANSESARQQSPDLISDSTTSNGGKALYLWLQSLGYQVERLEYERFAPDASVSVLFMLAPTSEPDYAELDALYEWVEDGGTLIIAGRKPLSLGSIPLLRSSAFGQAFETVLDEFGLELEKLEKPVTVAVPSQPLLLHPRVTEATVNAESYLTTYDSMVPYLGDPAQPVAASVAVGDGRVFVIARTYGFSNEGLKATNNAERLLNWLPSQGKAGKIVFDEIHHGRIAQRSVGYDVLHEPWGWAILYGLAMLFLYLLIGGRRFGRAIPAIPDNRRLAAEYVVSVAGLLRRGGKGTWVAQHYERMLRRQLASICGLDTDKDINILFERLNQIGTLPGNVDVRDVRRVLAELRAGATRNLSEAELVRLVAETDRISKALGGRR
jgi:hypothetical protein